MLSYRLGNLRLKRGSFRLMSGDDTKQVQDALQAIKKLVEKSEEQMSASDDVVMLDNVVWRNPVTDEQEELSQDNRSLNANAPDTPETAEVADSGSVGDRLAPSAGPVISGTSAVRDASISISPRDLDEIVRKPVTAQTPLAPAPPAIASPKIPSPTVTQATTTPPLTSPLPQARARAEELQSETKPPVPEIEDDITELTLPLGRRGGGFYDSDIPSALRTRPAIVTSVEKSVPRIETPASMPADSPSADASLGVKQAPKAAVQTSPVPVEPAITDFHGADFNFSAAEGLMTAASFRDLAGEHAPIAPEVNIPLAQPAVSDPASEAQAMFEEAPAFEDDSEDNLPAYPNLHIVSDKTAQDDSDDEEEGFSGAVRMALRSIIKEQVSTWLQGNMTGLIEEALTTPQKRPSSGAKSSKKKR